MKTTYLAAFAAAAIAFGTVSCNKDGDTIYTPGAEAGTVEGNGTDIVLDHERLGALVLTVYWNANGDITLSDPEVAPPAHAVTNVLQIASDPEFTNIYEETMGGGVYSRQFTCGELNNIVSRIGLEGGVQATVYLRLRSTIGANLEPRYSNVLNLNVTPYFIDMSFAKILDKDQNETGKILASPAVDGIYSGFMGAGAWENWWLREGNSVVWGNDGVSGTPFVLGNLSSGLEAWNFWFPGISGCYYTVVDTKANEWSALLLPEVRIGGDIDAVMTYDRKANKWTYTYNATAGTVNITLSSEGRQYNVASGTDDAAAAAVPVAFGGTPDALTFGTGAATTIALPVAISGETTITLDLNDPKAWKLEAAQGGTGPVETVSPFLYLAGVYGAGDWTFDYFLKLYNEDNKTYGGVNPVDSEWGYRMFTEAGNWDNYYTMVDGGSGFEGQLVANGEGNIAAPEAGLYLFDVSLSGLTYKLTPVQSVSYTGLNDDWNLYPMTATETPGVYTAQVTKTGNTPWGVKIVLNENWDLFFGGGSGELLLYRDGFDGDNDFEPGVLTLTVDLTKGTYSYTSL